MTKSNSKAVIDYRKRTKLRMVEAMGGKCVCCGYKGHPSVYDFHHLDPSTKSFGFGGARANNIEWPKLVIELRKCVMVCANCHREIEYDGREIPQDSARFNEVYADYKSLEITQITVGTIKETILPDQEIDGKVVRVVIKEPVNEVKILRH